MQKTQKNIIDKRIESTISGLIPIGCHFSISLLQIHALTCIKITHRKHGYDQNGYFEEEEESIFTQIYLPPTSSGNTIFIHRSTTDINIQSTTKNFSHVVEYHDDGYDDGYDDWSMDIMRTNISGCDVYMNLRDPSRIIDTLSDRIITNIDGTSVAKYGYEPRLYVLLDCMFGKYSLSNIELFNRIMDELEKTKKNYTMIINSTDVDCSGLIELVNNRGLLLDTKIFVMGKNGSEEDIEYLIT